MLGHANTWTGAQLFNFTTAIGPGFTLGSTAGGFSSWSLLANGSGNGNAVMNLATVGNAAVLSMQHGPTATQALSMGNNDLGTQFTDSSATDLNLAAASGNVLRIGAGFGTASVMQVSGSQVTIPSIKATTGTRFVCVDASGNFSSGTTASPCSGT